MRVPLYGMCTPHHHFWGWGYQGPDSFKTRLRAAQEAKVRIHWSRFLCLADVRRSPEVRPTNTTAVNPCKPTSSGQDLRAVAVELTRRSGRLPRTEGLVFVFPPSVRTHAPKLPAMNQNDPELHRLSLTLNAPTNHPVSEYERWLLTAKDVALMCTDGDQELDRLLCDLGEQFQALQHRKIEEWQRQQGGLHLRKRLKDLSNSLPRVAGCALVETGTCL